MTGNIFMLTADSLQQSYFSEAAETIAAETNGTTFTNAVAPSPKTASSMPVLATGRYADEIPTRGLPPAPQFETLAEKLQGEGYRTAMWSDNFLFGSDYNYDRGFSEGNHGEKTWKRKISYMLQTTALSPLYGSVEWLYFNFYKPFSDIVASEETFFRPATELNEAALSWLDNGSEPAFVWIHYMDTHHPYEPPHEYIDPESVETMSGRAELSQFSQSAIKDNGESLTDEEKQDVITAYEASCRYFSDRTQDFITRLRDSGHFDPDEDVLVLTADHGECFSPDRYDMMGHTPTAFWDEILNVPLVIARPDWPTGTYDRQVSLVDVFPTVLNSIGATPQNDVFGRPCSRPAEMFREYAISISNEGDTYRSVRSNSGRKIFGFNHPDGDRIVLSEKAGTPPQERTHRVFTNPSEFYTAELTPEWRELRGVLNDIGGPIEATESDATEGFDEEHLRALGYIE